LNAEIVSMPNHTASWHNCAGFGSGSKLYTEFTGREVLITLEGCGGCCKTGASCT
jgi:hypothetical protein